MEFGDDMKKALVFLLFFICTPLNAFSFSLVDDWSNIINPNGPWSYNEGNNPLQYNIADWPVNEFGESQTAWADSNSEVGHDFLPGWFKAVGDPNTLTTRTTLNDYDLMAGDVIVHTTDGSVGHGLANVTWTSPYSGIFNIDGGLWMGRDSGRRS